MQLFIKLGIRVAATICQLGYPIKNSLMTLHREYGQNLDLKPGFVRVPKFSHAQKARAVEHSLTHDRSVSFSAKALGYAPAHKVHHAQPTSHRSSGS